MTIRDVTVPGPNSVRLTTSPQKPGTRYPLTVGKIRDLAPGGGNLIVANSPRNFNALNSPQDQFAKHGILEKGLHRRNAGFQESDVVESGKHQRTGTPATSRTWIWLIVLNCA